MTPTRRTMLVSLGAAAALAGCLDDGDTDDTAGGGTDDTDDTMADDTDDTTTDDTDETTADDTTDDDDAAAATDATVSVVSNAFEPAFLTVEPGDTVEWQLEEGSHTVTLYHEDTAAQHRAPEEAVAFDDNIKDTFNHTFEQEGTYDYFCQPHEGGGMVGTVIVGDPDEDDHGLQAPASELPDGARAEIESLNEQTREEFDLDPVDGDSDTDGDSDDDSDADDGGTDDGGYGY